MRVAIVSDTHGVLDPRIAAIVQSSDYVVHAGDIGAASVLESLQPRRACIVVRGNNDVPAKWPSHEQGVLEQLPQEDRLMLPGGELVVTHGHRLGPVARRHERLRAAFPAARAIVYGHSHRLVMDLEHEPWVLNPGAAGRARTFGGPSCLVLRATDREWTVCEHRFAAPRPGHGVEREPSKGKRRNGR